MQTRVARDGRTVVPVARKGRTKVSGRSRAGYQAADLLLAMTEPSQKEEQDPRLEMPRILIETMRVVGPDDLTARDEALYKMLLAVARMQGIDRERHTVDMADMLDYLEIRSVDRAVESLGRITRTTVTYDLRQENLRRRATLPLIIAETTEDLKRGTATLEYSIPFPVRRAILDALSYAKLEINAFARFRCRYTARLYQRLALRAGYSVRDPWTIEPKQLAEELGFPVERWHYGTFLRDCLKPAMADIDNHVRRFHVVWQEVRGTGRGRPVEKLVFEPSEAVQRLDEAQAVEITRRMRMALEEADPVHSKDELPTTKDFAKAAGIVKRPAVELSEAFREALDDAKRDPSAPIGGGRRFLSGGMLLSTLRTSGPRAALSEWLRTLQFGKPLYPQERSTIKAAAQVPQMVPYAPDFVPLPDWSIDEAAEDHDPLDDVEVEDIEPPATFFDELAPTGEFADDIPF